MRRIAIKETVEHESEQLISSQSALRYEYCVQEVLIWSWFQRKCQEVKNIRFHPLEMDYPLQIFKKAGHWCWLWEQNDTKCDTANFKTTKYNLLMYVAIWCFLVHVLQRMNYNIGNPLTFPLAPSSWQHFNLSFCQILSLALYTSKVRKIPSLDYNLKWTLLSTVASMLQTLSFLVWHVQWQIYFI